MHIHIDSSVYAIRAKVVIWYRAYTSKLLNECHFSTCSLFDREYSADFFFFVSNFWRISVLFVEPLIALFWTFGEISPGFWLLLVWPWVWHLLTSSQPAWQPCLFDRHTCTHKHWWDSNPSVQHSMRSNYLSHAGSTTRPMLLSHLVLWHLSLIQSFPFNSVSFLRLFAF